MYDRIYERVYVLARLSLPQQRESFHNPQTKDEPNVALYCQDIDRMHKIVLGAESEAQLRKVAQDLTEKGARPPRAHPVSHTLAHFWRRCTTRY
jgi:hypothetical protein